MKKGQRIITLLLAAALICTALSGCAEKKMPAAEPETETELETVEPAAEDEHKYDIPYTTAFISKSAPEGYATPETISFYTIDKGGRERIENIPITEVERFTSSRDSLPRTSYFESYMPERMLPLLPVLDYAMFHGYYKMCIPTAEYEGTDVFGCSRYLRLTYHINEQGLSGRTVASFTNADGEKVNYVYISMLGMEYSKSVADLAANYREAIREAQRIVDSVPEDYSEYETAIYLYHYLTEHVRYYEDDYYGSDWNLLYDTLINHYTVCTGYTEALYVLFNLAGIECFSVDGPVYERKDNYEPGEYIFESYSYHTWNIAKLDGVYYEFDSTWDENEPVSEYCFFAVSTEDVKYYYPRSTDAFSESYCPPRTDSLFPRIDIEDDSLDFSELRAAFRIFNCAHASPMCLFEYFGYEIDPSAVTATEDGWVTVPVDYDDFIYEVYNSLSRSLTETFFDGYIRNEDGQAAYNPNAPVGNTYRFCGFEDGKPIVYVFDERGNFTPCEINYHIGDNGRYYIIDRLSLADGSAI